MSLDYDYEFIFPNSIFQQNIYNLCTITLSTELNTERQLLIENKVYEIQTVFNNIPGIRIFSTFLETGDKKYKITVSK